MPDLYRVDLGVPYELGEGRYDLHVTAKIRVEGGPYRE